jgi:excinuclease ABC subunit B
MNTFTLVSDFKPTGNQPDAIKEIIHNVQNGISEQVLLGVTGSGKTFTIANVIEHLQKPSLVISHNKTLAAQLYQEFREFFPNNAVSYFVSYYDYYQPEAYIPSTNTYIEKETDINEEIDKLRLAATTNILTRKDTIVVASVSSIYNIGSPKEYGNFVLMLTPMTERQYIIQRLVQLQYERNDYSFSRGTFRVRGDSIDIFPAYEDIAVRWGNHKYITRFNPLTGKSIEKLPSTMIYPAKHYMTDPASYSSVFSKIEKDMDLQEKKFKKEKRFIEAQRIREKVTYDLEMIHEIGYVNGIENYSRYFDGREPGEPPYTLLDYFNKDWLLIIDESHMTIPQIRGMYNGDRSRKQILIDYGFRLPAALDNRPLRFDEFLRKIPQTIYVSATPDDWELSRGPVVEQLVRPTGLLDPKVSIRPVNGQINDLTYEIKKRIKVKQRVLVTTLTKQMAEDLAEFLSQHGIRVHYLHADIQTLDRSDILTNFRDGKYDVVVGVNLLREGLDLPEVSLVAILDADKEGFLRSRVSLIQTMGRAARHVSGEVILYADIITVSIKKALVEVERRRKVQEVYNKKYSITPKSINKPIRKQLVENKAVEIEELPVESMTPMDKKKYIKNLTYQMHDAARNLNFELAIKLRDKIDNLQRESL